MIINSHKGWLPFTIWSTVILIGVSASLASAENFTAPKPTRAETFTDKYLLTFDENCMANSKLAIAEHVQQKLFQLNSTVKETADKSLSSALLAHQGGSNFLLVNETLKQKADNAFQAVATERLRASDFLSLVDKHLNASATIMKAGREAAKKRRPVTRRLMVVGDESTEHGQSDEDEASEEDEDGIVARNRNEIMSLVHLMAASELVGPEKVNDILSAEKEGDIEKVVKMVREHAPPSVVTELDDARLVSKLTDKKRMLDAERQYKRRRLQNYQAESEMHLLATAVPVPVITDNERFSTLKIDLVENPFLGEHMGRLLSMIPCVSLGPEPDQSKDALSDQFEPQILEFEDSKKASALDLPTGIMAKAGRMESTKLPPHDRLLSRRLRAGNETTPEVFTFRAPNDYQFPEQWYVNGPAQGQMYGANVISGWATALVNSYGGDDKAPANLLFSEYLKRGKGETVAILDSGCSKNKDLVNQFWRNPDSPGCNNSTFVGSGEGSDRDCIGYDFGDDDPDPTNEIRFHGSSTGGIVAAEGNNDAGISGICPTCKVMCLKIYDSEKQKITMSAVVRALEYIAKKKIRISNHSYGGFGVSSVEQHAHQALEATSHLSVCSSGNNGCDIDSNPVDDSFACRDDDGNRMPLFTPAGYDLNSILSVGGTTKTGEAAWFSNFGKQNVDLFAPGDNIVTLYGMKMATVKGTSFSSPLVAGVAAVLWSARPGLSALEVKQILMDSGTPVSFLKNKAVSPVIVNLQASLGMETPAGLKFSGSGRDMAGSFGTSAKAVGLLSWVPWILWTYQSS